MRFAYLISAYTDAPQVARLIRALGPGCSCFVHVDARVDIAPFVKACEKLAHVHFLMERHAVIWGDITQVYYQRDLLRACVESGLYFDRIFMLSGQDYPVSSPEELAARYVGNKCREDICGIDLTTQRASVKHPYRIYRPQCRLPFKNLGLTVKWRVALRTLLYFLGVRKRLSLKVGSSTYYVHKGSDYWSITPDLAQWMLRELDAFPAIMDYFSTMFVPSELIWQTLAAHSPFAEKMDLRTGPYKSLADLTPIHYIDYHPYIRVMTEEDWPKVLESGRPFCRKVATGKSDAFVALCEERKAALKKQTADE